MKLLPKDLSNSKLDYEKNKIHLKEKNRSDIRYSKISVSSLDSTINGDTQFQGLQQSKVPRIEEEQSVEKSQSSQAESHNSDNERSI